MAKIIKGKPLPHVMIVDTNILWLKDKGPAVNPEFDTFWADHIKLVELELLLPEVVRGELLFQQVTSCLKLLDKVNEHVAEISSISGKRHRQKANKAGLLTQVTLKIDRWIKSKEARVVSTPFNGIDWQNVCHSAIWRIPPFTSDPKNPDNEKGFRDALIYETVINIVTNEARTVNIAFVCNDHLLRTTVANRLKSDHRFACYENLTDFSSYIKLTRESLTNEFIKKIVKRAGEKFYSPADPNCLWNKEQLPDKMDADPQFFKVDEIEYPGLFGQSTFALASAYDPPKLDLGSGIIGSALATPWIAGLPSSGQIGVQASRPAWQAAGTHYGYIGPCEFEKVSGERTYHWQTKVVYYRKYISTQPVNVGILPDTRVQIVNFSVHWRANVKDDARFHDIALDNLKFDGKEFKSPSAEENEKAQGKTPAHARSCNIHWLPQCKSV